MTRTATRLLQLLSLLQTRPDWSGAELSDQLGIDPRTVRRDIERLRALGYPIAASPGVGGGYAFRAGADLPPLLLDDDEAFATTIALRTAAMGAVVGIEEAALRALTKLERVMPARLARRVDAMREAILPLQPGGPLIDASLLSTLAMACRDQVGVSFRYGDSHHRKSEREVDPLALVAVSGRWYLIAWDNGREDWRTFRLDRILGAPVPGRHFRPRPAPAGDLHDYVTRSLAIEPYLVRIEVVIHGQPDLIRRRIPPAAAQVETIDGNTCLLRFGAPTLDGAIYWLMALELPFEVREPPALRARLVAALERLTGYLGPTSRGGAPAPVGGADHHRDPTVDAAGAPIAD